MPISTDTDTETGPTPGPAAGSVPRGDLDPPARADDGEQGEQGEQGPPCFGRVGPDPGGAALDRLSAGLDALAGANAWALSDGELSGGLARLIGLERRTAAARLTLIAELERRGPAALGGACLTGWLKAVQRQDPDEAHRAV